MRTRNPNDCNGHARFQRRADAVASSKRMRDRGRVVDVFGCGVCAGWHVGGTTWLRGAEARPVRRTVQIMAGGLE